jgi:hypothetical protein
VLAGMDRNYNRARRFERGLLLSYGFDWYVSAFVAMLAGQELTVTPGSLPLSSGN